MSFLPANIWDAELLYKWRREKEAGPWYQGGTGYDEHQEWLRARIHNPLVKILIWHENGVPTGAVRIDSNNELSFCGGDARMLEEAVKLAPKLKATVDLTDETTWRRLEQGGFQQYPARFYCIKGADL
jgi:hypothetical protein